MKTTVTLVLALSVSAAASAEDLPPKLWEQVVKLTASDGAVEDRFGFSVSISGDTAVVGAYWDDDRFNDSGSAYVFERDHEGADSWGKVAKLYASDAAARDHFGVSVSISGDTLVVGAYANDGRRGSAYIFERDQGGEGNWGEVKRLTASDTKPGDRRFGYSVSISGDMAVVGAYRDDDPVAGANSGSAYIFARDQGRPDNWGEVTKLMASDAAVDEYFGVSVSISGNTVVVGAFAYAKPGTKPGSAYIFERDRDGADAWGQVRKLAALPAAVGDLFGNSVSISGDTVVVGAPLADEWWDDTSGSVYVFERNRGGANEWGEVTRLVPSDTAAGDWFGSSVSVSGDTALVGAILHDGGYTDSGSAYLFRRGLGGPDKWGQVTKLTAPDAAGSDRFGRSVSISSDTLVVGADWDDDSGVNSGSAYLHRFSGPELTMPTRVAAAVDIPVDVPVDLVTNGNEIVGAAFSIDFDESCLDFDPTDADADDIPDAIALQVPGDYDVAAFFDLGDSDGEIDILVVGASSAPPLPDGLLATATFTATCVPEPWETILAPVVFSSDPAPSFSDTSGQPVAGTTTATAVEILPGVRGDCNGDGIVGIADPVSCELEFSDGDRSFWLDVPGGRFAGDPVGCDSNADTRVDAGDVSCTGRLIFGLECGVGHSRALSALRPRLSLPLRPRVTGDDVVVVPVSFWPAGNAITSVVFSLDFDEMFLSFDDTDSDGDGVPDAVRFVDPQTSRRSVRFDAEDTSGELDFLIADLKRQPQALAPGLLVEVELRLIAPTDSLAGSVSFSQEPMASFGNVIGRSVPGTAQEVPLSIPTK